MHFYITGDTHGDFRRIEQFCLENDTTVEDVMIILGDAGINYHLDSRDNELKEELSQLDITLFCIHGNHEARPWEAGDYDEKEWNGGIVYVEEQYPNLLFAKDGEIYYFNGRSVIVIGGAYSVDKYYRLNNGLMWFDTEQPDKTTVDKSTEKWLQTIHDNLDLREGWYAGHYHCESEENGIRIMYEDFDEIYCEE